MNLSNAQKLYKGITEALYNTEYMLFAGHWVGVFGISPGIGAGYQAIESYHAQWGREMMVQCRSKVDTCSLPCNMSTRSGRAMFVGTLR